MKDPTTIEEQAALLARWLDEHPGAAPPDGVDPDVLETIYALRPDLAPAPSFSIDDILADISSGPFAAPAIPAARESGLSGAPDVAEQQPHEDQPAADELDDEAPTDSPVVVDLASERRRRSPWMWSAAGAVAAAAMALIVAIPHLDRGISDKELYAPVAQAPQPAATVSTIPEVAELAEREATVEPEPDEPAGGAPRRSPTQPSLDPAGPAPKAAADAPAQGITDGLVAGIGGSSSATGADGAEGRSTELERAQHELADLRADASKPASEPPGRWFAPSGSTAAGPDDASLRAEHAPVTSSTPQAAVPQPAAAPEPTPSATAGGYAGEAPMEEPAYDAEESLDYGGSAYTQSWDDDAGADADAFDEAAPLAEAELAAEDQSRDRSAPSERRKVAEEEDVLESASDTRSAASRERGFGGARSSRSGQGRADNLADIASAPASVELPSIDDLRAQANPLDYRSDWYVNDPVLDPVTKSTLATAYGQTQQSIVAGDATTPEASLESLLASPHPRVIQDAAFRIATLQLQQGYRADALTTVDRGLAASSSPTVFRSRLLALRGSILEEQGDTAGAMEAYQQAVDANASR